MDPPLCPISSKLIVFFDMIPLSNYTRLALKSKHAYAARTERKQSASHCRQAYPAGRKNPEDMSMREQCNRATIVCSSKRLRNHRIGTLSHVLDRLTTDDRMGPHAPLRSVQLAHLLGCLPFTLAVVPLLKVIINDRNVSVPSNFARLNCPFPRAYEYSSKLRPCEEGTQATGALAPTAGQWNIGPTGMPSVKTPFCLSVTY
jgi:hypothetical protein